VPLLPLAGEWLAEAGFCVGARARVSVVEPGRLVVTHVDEAGEELAPLRPLVWIGAEELARLAAAPPAAACAPAGGGPWLSGG
jgi:Toxin SymE, type I toxin-antitoxin system